MTVSEVIDQILHKASEKGDAYHPEDRGVSEIYEIAFKKAINYGLVKPISKDSYELTREGERAIKLNGFDNWVDHEA